MHPTDSTSDFDDWFVGHYGAPTAVQRAAWPLLRRRRHALLIASTGQGKTLAAWRPLVERMCVQPLVGSGVRALHVAPLKALARDVVTNLQPLLQHAGRIRAQPVSAALRCGDTSYRERRRQRSLPPEILSTTPESLFVLLGSPGGRRLLSAVDAVVIDELHALMGSKRGAHLALSLARLDRLTEQPVQRIGLSATARPTGLLAEFLSGGAECEVVEPEPPGDVALRIELPEMRLGPFPTTTHWAQIHARVAAMALAPRQQHAAGPGDPGLCGASGVADACARPETDDARCAPPSLLVFCQTRAQVERSAAALDALLSEWGRAGEVGAHHGSLDTEHRERLETRFKHGALRVMVSSASLELGLDLGSVDRVCQLGVPGSINLVRQRAGRSGHRPGAVPCMHLFPLTAHQLIEAHALRETLAAGRIEASPRADGPRDVLAQHLVAMAAAGIDSLDEMTAIAGSAAPYRDVDTQTVEKLLTLLAVPETGMPEEQVVRLLERDAHGRYRPTAGAGRLVLVNAGTIPEFFEYDVVRTDTGEKVGRLDEEFAFESSPGQVIQLGRRPWRVVRVRTGEVRVEPVDEDAVELPFWFGEGPGRTPETAAAVLATMARVGSGNLHPWACSLLAESREILGALPSPDRLVIERFPDPNGDRHVVLHTMAGARINRAWGLALRKRFCRQFNFELQAAATDDGVLISLGVTSQFELADVARFVNAATAAHVLTQALLDTPIFVTRFRWAANNALLLLKNDLRGRTPPQRQRSQAENLIACVFPDQLACVENLSGPREVPDHALVRQALADCLNEYMDLGGLEALLARIESGATVVHAVDTPQPSPLAEALVHAPRYSYLDEAAAEERRTRNFEGRATRLRRPPAQSGAVDAPSPRSAAVAAGVAPTADALEALLLQVGFLTATEGERGWGMRQPAQAGGWTRCFSHLVRDRRALSVRNAGDGPRLWVAADRLGWILALLPGAEVRPWLAPALLPAADVTAGDALRSLAAARRMIDGDAAETVVASLLGVGAAA